MQFRIVAFFLFTTTLRVAAAVDVRSPGGGAGDRREGLAPVVSPVATVTPSRWIPIWEDEFSQSDGARPDPRKWILAVGGGGWGNAELETYTDRPENARIEGGKLLIVARRERAVRPDGTIAEFTSARLSTRGRFEQTYGRFEARIKVPAGQGFWPAFWMIGANVESSGWPACGEIDVMENIGREPGAVHGTVHGPGFSGSGGLGAVFRLPAGEKFSDGFHVFGAEWTAADIRFDVDGRVYARLNRGDIPPGGAWVFDHPFYVILNLAVGGDWPGNPDETTRFPHEMSVDWVRAFSAAH
jgi:beta-glucanase (GH16 family)